MVWNGESFTPAEAQLSARIADCWGSFARAGLSWLELEPRGPCLQLNPSPMGQAMNPKTGAFWDGLDYPGSPMTGEGVERGEDESSCC